MVVGVIFAIIVSIFFSLYIIPRKFTKMNPVLYMVFVGASFFTVSIIFYFAVNKTSIGYNETLWNTWHLLSALQGILWFAGGVFLNISIDKIGLSKSNQWKNLQGPIGSILMIIFISDVTGTAIFFVLGGILLMIISAILFTIRKDNEQPRNIKGGVVFAILAAILFGVNAFIQKTLTNEGFVFSKDVYFAFFVFLSAIIFYLIRYKKPKDFFMSGKQILLPLSAGALYSCAAIFSTLAYTLIAGSIVFSIIQLNTVWTILIGILVFKEINFKMHWRRIVCGFIFAIGALVLLLFAL